VVEQRPVKALVVGSSPTSSAICVIWIYSFDRAYFSPRINL
jgi:hypothetical protein